MDPEENLQQNSDRRILKFEILSLYGREIDNEFWMDLETNLQQNSNCRSLKYEILSLYIREIVDEVQMDVEPQTCTHLPILPASFSYSFPSSVIISFINLFNSLYYRAF